MLTGQILGRIVRFRQQFAHATLDFWYASFVAACRDELLTSFLEAPVRTEVIRRDEYASVSA